MLLVAVIILFLTALSTPVFRRTYDDLRLTSSAKDMANIMRFCRERAVFERRLFEVNIGKDKNTYRIFVIDENKDKPVPLTSSWGRIFRITDNISVETESSVVDFYPDGTSSGASVYLINKTGAIRTLLVEKETGIVKVYDYKKE